jgi:hypothetical protein
VTKGKIRELLDGIALGQTGWEGNEDVKVHSMRLPWYLRMCRPKTRIYDWQMVVVFAVTPFRKCIIIACILKGHLWRAFWR